MKQAIILIGLTVVGLEAGYLAFGYKAVADVAYGAIAVMAMLIAVTFLWLWFVRATPLAIGMVVSWLGVAGVAGWWWSVNLLGQPGWAQGHPGLFAILALPMVGSVLHFAVIQRSFGYHGMHFLWPVAISIVVSVSVYVVF